MNVNEIKNAVREGKKVFWNNEGYEVVLSHFKSGEEQWLIKCSLNGSCIGLTWTDGITLNGKEEDFYMDVAVIEGDYDDQSSFNDDDWHDSWESHEFGDK